MRGGSRVLSVCAFVGGFAVAAAAQAPTAELLAILPDDTEAVLSVPAPEQAVLAITAFLLPVPAGLPPDVVAWLGAGAAFVQLGLGGSLAETAAAVAGNGLVLGVQPGSPRPGLLLVARPRDIDAALQATRRLTGRVHATVREGLLLASDSAAGLQRLQERVGAPAGRWGTFDFGADADAGPAAVVRAAVDLAAVRRRLPAGALQSKLDGVARIVMLPLAHASATASVLRFRFCADATGLRLDASADASILETTFAPLFAAGKPPPLVPLAEDGLAFVRLDRGIHALFGDLEKYLPPDDVLAAQGFLSIADALDGARSSFADDLLGGLQEPFVLHVMPPAGTSEEPRSPLCLPEFALVAGVRDAEVEPIVLQLAQVFTTIANAERAQRGKGAFRLRRESDATGTGFVAEPPPWQGPGLPPVDRQLSPTLWCGRGLVVLASSDAAARRIVERAGDVVPMRGDVLELRGPAIAAVLAANRAPLELARMLDEGEDPATVRRFFQIVDVVLGAMQRLVVRCEVDATTTRFTTVVERVR